MIEIQALIGNFAAGNSLAIVQGATMEAGTSVIFNVVCRAATGFVIWMAPAALFWMGKLAPSASPPPLDRTVPFGFEEVTSFCIFTCKI